MLGKRLRRTKADLIWDAARLAVCLALSGGAVAVSLEVRRRSQQSIRRRVHWL